MNQPVGNKKPAVATVGTFDGVHRGHQSVLSTVVVAASARDMRPLAVTFDRHPLEVVRPGHAPGLIMDLDDRDNLLRKHGLEVLRVEFNRDICRLTCEQWMRRLAEEEGMKVLVLGYDNTFGSDGVELSFEDYRRIGKTMGVEVMDAPVVAGCSSSAARRAIAAGNMQEARAILGRPYQLAGRVAHGREIGRTIGFPTANIPVPSRRLLPAPGVYGAEACLENGDRFKAVVNVGNNPTVADAAPVTVEAHLIGFEGNLYDENVRIEFADRLRQEKKFNSLDELRRAIADDIARLS